MARRRRRSCGVVGCADSRSLRFSRNSEMSAPEANASVPAPRKTIARTRSRWPAPPSSPGEGGPHREVERVAHLRAVEHDRRDTDPRARRGCRRSLRYSSGLLTVGSGGRGLLVAHSVTLPRQASRVERAARSVATSNAWRRDRPRPRPRPRRVVIVRSSSSSSSSSRSASATSTSASSSSELVLSYNFSSSSSGVMRILFCQVKRGRSARRNLSWHVALGHGPTTSRRSTCARSTTPTSSKTTMMTLMRRTTMTRTTMYLDDDEEEDDDDLDGGRRRRGRRPRRRRG